MGKDLFKGVAVAVLIIEIAFLKNVLNDAVARNVDDLHILGNSSGTLHVMLLGVEENVVSLVACGGIDLNKMILKGADQDQIPFF